MENKIGKLEIPKDEVLRYLGYRSQLIDEKLDELIKLTIEESKTLITPRFITSRCNVSLVENGVKLLGTTILLTGNDIKEHLKDSKECVLMGVTIGGNIEKRINLYGKTNLTKSLILDSCATTAVEEICDKLEAYIKSEAIGNGESITFRYSPGYGDLSLDVQKDIINTLKAEKTIGLTVSAHNLLIPRKSVTAIIGLIPKDKEVQKKCCEVCKNYENCSFRKEGIVCGS